MLVGDSVAFPVLRTGDAETALAVACALVCCSSSPDRSVFVDAELTCVIEVMKARDMFPESFYTSGNVFLRAEELPQGPAELARLLPVTFSAETDERGELPCGTVLLLGGARCGQLAWMGVRWPAVPELGLGPEWARTGVQASFNSTADGEPAVGHTVLVHVRRGEDERAGHLARQVGQTLIGPEEEGW